MKKVVYTQRVEVIESYNERRDCADQRIAEYLSACGYLPVPIPNNKQIAIDIIKEIQPIGIVFTGGNSLLKYGGDAPERDETETAILQYAIDSGIPVFGFCRGAQVIMDFFGEELEEVKGHVAKRHKICGRCGELEVNSYHNQGCVEIKNDSLEVLMKSKDGVVEMVRHKTLPIIATMWHPERETPFCEYDMNIINNLFQEERV